MDLSQIKLSKTEWVNIEIPVSQEEQNILKLICDGYHTPTIQTNDNLSILTFLNIEDSPENEVYLYNKYFVKEITNMCDKYSFKYSVSKDASKLLKRFSKNEPKKIDQMRIQNMEKDFKQNKMNIFEFLLLDFTHNCIKEKHTKNTHYAFYLYSLIQFKKSSIKKINAFVVAFVDFVVETMEKITPRHNIIYKADEYIEKNSHLIKYENRTLFSHQQELFQEFSKSIITDDLTPKLVLYIAPTGTGKTLSPIGLSEEYIIIFVCVARHIGLALAKSSISMGKKVAFAFGCETASDIRLHNFSAKDYIKNKRSGGIGKVDNTNGEKVQIMICDVKSYIVAMHYMLAFHPKDDIILYWDEPTITMDYDNHEIHPYIHRNWIENVIPKIVLSCATLPKENEISATIAHFDEKFGTTTNPSKIVSITSYDCKKTISLLNRDGKCALPHLMFSKYDDLLHCVEHCKNNKTLLRYFDVKEIIRFIQYTAESDGLIQDDAYLVDNYFKQITDITMISLKLYYLELLKNIDAKQWFNIYIYLTSTQTTKFISPLSNHSSADSQLRKIKSEVGVSSVAPISIKEKPIYRQQSIDAGMASSFTTGSETAKSTISINPHQGILLTTQDAHTLTDGPTIYIVEDVMKIARFYITQSQIPEKIFTDLISKIAHNNRIQEQMTILEKSIEDSLGKEVEKEKKMEREHFTREVREMKASLARLQDQIQMVHLRSLYIPNFKEHQERWIGEDKLVPNAFIPTIEEDDVIRIMGLDVDIQLKILLLLGIGAFIKGNTSIGYMEIMKMLAYKQRLYLIIASSDYIYGTNYQFCHGFLGKDLQNMTQQKTIQGLGRIGRNNIQQEYTIRFRDNDILTRLFKPMDRNVEAVNMSSLFCS